MAKITVAHMRSFLDLLSREKISFSRMVEMLNEIAADTTKCKSCGRDLDAHAIKSTGLCTSCFTCNA